MVSSLSLKAGRQRPKPPSVGASYWGEVGLGPSGPETGPSHHAALARRLLSPEDQVTSLPNFLISAVTLVV